MCGRILRRNSNLALHLGHVTICVVDKGIWLDEEPLMEGTRFDNTYPSHAVFRMKSNASICSIIKHQRLMAGNGAGHLAELSKSIRHFRWANSLG
jgi:hypothetical protein